MENQQKTKLINTNKDDSTQELSEQTPVDEYNILASFANKILSDESKADHEIQNIIDEHFWDMI